MSSTSADELFERGPIAISRSSAASRSQIGNFFGAGLAAKVIGADVDARAALIAGPEATKANPSILKARSVVQLMQR